MNLSRRALRFSVLAATVVIGGFLACGNSPRDIAGGGSDLPNGAVASLSGIVYLYDATPGRDAEVILRSGISVENGDSVVEEFHTVAGEGGVFSFDSVPWGPYSLYGRVEHGGRRLSGLLQNELEVRENDIARDILLHPSTNFRGRMVTPPGISVSCLTVFVPGTDIRITPDAEGRFSLEQVPRGEYDIAYACGATVNYTRIGVQSTCKDTFVLPDLPYTPFGYMADDSMYTRHRFALEQSFYMSPRHYRQGNTPQRYSEVEREHVRYYSRRSDGAMHRWFVDSVGKDGMELVDTVVTGCFMKLETDSFVIVVPPVSDTFSVVNGVEFMMYGGMVIQAALQREQATSWRILDAHSTHHPCFRDSLYNEDSGFK